MSSSSVEQVDHRRLHAECASSVLDIIQKEIARLSTRVGEAVRLERLGSRERREGRCVSSIPPFTIHTVVRVQIMGHRAARYTSAERRHHKLDSDAERCFGEKDVSFDSHKTTAPASD